MAIFFIALQCVLLFFMLFHDWIPASPLNNISDLKKVDSNVYRLFGSTINGLTVLIPLIITGIYYHRSSIPLFAMTTVTTFYLIITIGTILSWWVPYFFGSSQKHKQAFNKFKNTHQFLPLRGDHVRPNTLHIILHLQVWACLGISIYFLMK
ncbi:MAG: hypothetical protein HY860_06710 [Chlamydiales bacterium]|nr:hypothetical protein [Chlamydiales bacterium]